MVLDTATAAILPDGDDGAGWFSMGKVVLTAEGGKETWISIRTDAPSEVAPKGMDREVPHDCCFGCDDVLLREAQYASAACFGLRLLETTSMATTSLQE